MANYPARESIYRYTFERAEEEEKLFDIDKFEQYLFKATHTYTPKGIYNAAEISLNAERCRTYKIRQEQVRLLKEIPSVENLWQAVIAFQEYPFKTATGLPFRYKLKVGKNGEYNRELLIDRREKSKSLPGVVWCWHLKIVRGFQKK